MDWQESIIQRLNLREKSKKVVLDEIGILFESQFTDYLTANQIQFVQAENIKEIINGLRAGLLVFTKTTSIPDFLSSQAEVIHFDANRLPIDIEADVVKSLSNGQLMLLLDYQISHQNLCLIRSSNFPGILNEAENYYRTRKIEILRQNIDKIISQISNFDDILSLGDYWGEYQFLCFKNEISPDATLQQSLDANVEPLILQGLTRNAFFAPISDFKTVNNILPFIHKQQFMKKALVCFDGMGLTEWHFLKDYLKHDFNFEEKQIFALIPTTTRISRTAIYYANAEKVYSTNSVNEEKSFQEIFPELSTGFYREGDIYSPDKFLGIDLVTVIYNVFDELAHKTVFPPLESDKNLYLENIRQYLEHSTIRQDLRLLLDSGYKIWFCSDHGNMLASGNGQKIDKYLIESSSKRGTLIGKSELAHFYDVNYYEIPFVKEKMVLLAKSRTAFMSKQRKEITHGGITVDELIVPFVEVKD